MNRPAAALATLSTEQPQAKQDDRPVGLWVLAVVLVAIAIIALALDMSLTMEQRVALFLESGTFP